MLSTWSPIIVCTSVKTEVLVVCRFWEFRWVLTHKKKGLRNWDTWLHSLSSQSFTWTKHQKTSGSLTFRRMILKWRCLGLTHNTTFGEHTSCPAWWWRGTGMGLFGHLGVTELTVNASVYWSILESNLRPSVWQLKLGPNSVMQQDNDPQHSSKNQGAAMARSMFRPQLN